MNNLYKFIFTAFFMLACGVSTLPTGGSVNKDVHIYTAQPTPQPTSAPTKSTGAVVCATGVENGQVNLRACAGTACAGLGVLQDGESVVILADRAVITIDRATWRRVKAGDLVGWVNSKYLCEE